MSPKPKSAPPLKSAPESNPVPTPPFPTPLSIRELRYQVNPCDIDRFEFLKPVGDAAAALWDEFVGEAECVCCLGVRLALTLVASALFGAGVAGLAVAALA